MNKVFELGELFCGPGGIAWGATHAICKDSSYKIVHKWANDYDESTCETYRKNICPNNPKTVIYEDVRKLDLSTLEPITALAFGFPCNDYSQVGEQKGINGNYGPLYSYGIRALTRFQPDWFLAENVGGLLNSNEGKTFSKILREMENAGYTVYPHLYKFEEYGIPQARHRIIIVGIKNALGIEFRVPSPKGYKIKTCKEAIENPPIPDNSTNNEPTRQSTTVIERLKHIKEGENAFTADLPEELQLNVTGAKISQIYKRLDSTRPSYTVTGSGGGGTHIYHWSENRALTNRERARLQTFPDDYEFVGSKEAVRKQIGMAVPCDGAKIIFEAILNSFAGKDYPSIECNATEYLYLGEDDIKWQFNDDLENKVLFDPIKKGANELRIVSAYASPSMLAYHSQKIKDLNLPPIKIKLCVGMCPFDGLNLITHKGFQKMQHNNLDPESSEFECSYVYQAPPVHSKIYLWLKNGKPFKAFAGSANYTQKAFSQGCGEFVTECNLNEAFAYYEEISKRSIFCTDNEVENYIRIYRKSPTQSYESSIITNEKDNYIKLSLLTSKGDVAKSSGINWGQREHRNPDQAYIPLPSKVAKSGFFPLNKRHFTVITDDGQCFIMRVEQDGDKAITTPEDNAEIGNYLRSRLSLDNGELVTVEHLNKYGRSDITFTKLDDEHFELDFSIDKTTDM